LIVVVVGDRMPEKRRTDANYFEELSGTVANYQASAFQGESNLSN